MNRNRRQSAPTRPPAAAGPTLFDTRRASHAAIAPELNRLQSLVLEYFRSCGSMGATDEQLADGLAMKESTLRARRVELAHARRIVDSGQRRRLRSGREGIVWVAAADLQQPADREQSCTTPPVAARAAIAADPRLSEKPEAPFTPARIDPGADESTGAATADVDSVKLNLSARSAAPPWGWYPCAF
jgi:hypothetical protein